MNRYEQEAERILNPPDRWPPSRSEIKGLIAAALQAEAERVTERDASIAKYCYSDVTERAIRQAQKKESGET